MDQSQLVERLNEPAVIDSQVVIAEHVVNAVGGSQPAERVRKPAQARFALDQVAGEHYEIRLQRIGGGDHLDKVLLSDAAGHVQIGDVHDAQLSAGRHPGEDDPLLVHVKIDDLVAGNPG